MRKQFKLLKYKINIKITYKISNNKFKILNINLNLKTFNVDKKMLQNMF